MLWKAAFLIGIAFFLTGCVADTTQVVTITRSNEFIDLEQNGSYIEHYDTDGTANIFFRTRVSAGNKYAMPALIYNNNPARLVAWVVYGDSYSGNAMGLPKENLSRIYSASLNMAIGPFYENDFTLGTNNTALIRLKGVNQSIILEQESGSYTSGEAYVCINNNGEIYAKDSACS